MDQDAFRNLLASGSVGSGGSKPKSRGVLGGPAPKRGGWGIKAKPGHEYKPPAETASTTIAPRTQKKKDVNGGKYVDRAALRREGKEDEYTLVEQLLEDLEKRQKQEGVDREEVERQRAYLGGDATHTILVKGLDHALLARTRAELAAKGEEVADEELEALVQAKGKKEVQKANKAESKDERGEKGDDLAKGFKPIAAKDGAGPSEKKKKKKKKVKQEAVEPDAAIPAPSKQPAIQKDVSKEEQAGPSRVKEEKPFTLPTPPPVDDDDDIFGDAGDYDLKAGREDEDTTDEEEEGMDLDGEEETKLARSRSPSPSRLQAGSDERQESRDSREHRNRDHRDRSYSRERYRDPSSDRGDLRRRYSPSPDRYRERDSYSGHYDDRRRSPGRGRYDERDRFDDRRRSYSRERYDDRYHSKHQRLPSPRRYSPRSRSPSPPPKRARQKTRSPSPLTFDFIGRAPSPTPSEESDNDLLVGGKLQPLQSSALQDVKGYLSLDAEAAKDEERRARKAKWRARQGLGVQEGSERYLEREVGEKEKMNRDYVNVMNQMKKNERGV